MKTWCILLIGVLLLTGCNAALSATTEPVLPPVKADADVIMVEGVVEPARWVTLRAADSSAVAEVFVADGDMVYAGDALLRLDDTDAQLAIRQAEAALNAAQAHLALAQAGARPEQIAVLEAHVAVANAVISQTTALVTASQVSGIEADVAEAQTAIATAAFAYRQAGQTHDDTMQCVDVTMSDGNAQHICPALGTYEEMARAQVAAAQAALDAAQAQLAALRSPTGAQIAAAQANVQTALAQRDALQAQLDLARAGTTAATLAVAKAAVREAETALAAVRILLADRTLTAPFDAIVSDIAVRPGDVAAPGSALVTLATLDALHIRTKDLTELDIARVTEGQLVHVTFDARPDAAFTGRVTRIDHQGQDYLGDVIYPVFIELDAMPAWAMWGMTANCEVQMANGEWQMANNESPITDHASRILAEAVIEPEHWAEARFTVPGKVVEVPAQPGMRVKAGEVLVRLDATHAEAAVRQAEATLATAQAGLALARTGPRAEKIAAAEAQVAAAEGDLARAIAQRNQWTVAGRDAQVAAARAQREAARAEKRQLEAQWQWAKDAGDDKRAQTFREQIAVVEQKIAAAQTRLAAIPRVFAAQTQAADAGVRVAEAQRAAAQAELALVQAGPRVEEINVAQAAVRQAEAALAAAQDTLAHAELRAPFDGTVTQVYVETGDVVTPERPVLVLATLDRLQVRTRDTLENDVSYVSVGQAVTVKADALPEVAFTGRVVQIEPQGILYRGDMAFPVIIALDAPSPALLWGMKAVVEILIFH